MLLNFIGIIFTPIVCLTFFTDDNKKKMYYDFHESINNCWYFIWI